MKCFLALLVFILPSPGLLASSSAPGCPQLEGGIVRWIVPARPGGGYDAYSRLIQPFLERELGVQMHIENRPEAGGLVAALALRDARPDGRTLGILNASGLLAAQLIEGSSAPDPATDFTIIGQVVSNRMVVFTGADSGFADVDELLAVAQSRPIVVGVRDAGSASFFSVPVTADLLGMDYVLVSGYVGSAARTLAVMRGDVDIIVGTYDSMSSQVRAGELIPLLQLSAQTDDGLAIPRLGGPGGWAHRRAGVRGRSEERAVQEASDLADIVGAGRLVMAPPDLPADLSACLEARLGEVLQSTEFLQAADRAKLSIHYQDSATAHRGLATGALGVDQFRELIRTAIKQVRE